MNKNELKSQVALVVRACQEKKAENISVLRLDEQASGFTDYFILCSATNPRQVQAIADEVDKELSAIGIEPKHTEGYTQAEWLLMDYVDFVVHIFSESARKFYDLERLWKTATRIEPAELEKPVRKPAVKKAAKAAKTAKTAMKKTAGKATKATKTAAKAAPRKRAPAKRTGKSS